MDKRLLVGKLASSFICILSLASCGFGEQTPRRNTDLSSLPDTVRTPVPQTFNSDGYRDASGDQDALEELELLLRPEEVVDYVAEENHFILLEGWQGGMYTVDVWYRAEGANPGTSLFLRATDVETGQLLSEETIKRDTEIEVPDSASEGFVYLPGEQDNVVVYEGYPDDPYPVLFELIELSPDGGQQIIDADVYLIAGYER